jgi:hypothetical protein
MLKRTIKFIIYCVFILAWGCSDGPKELSALEIQHHQDSVSETRIDSAYAAIGTACDTMMVYQVPVMVDSFLKDSALIQAFFDTTLFSDADKKVEKVIRQLQADCDSNLLKETYRRAQLRQKLKPVRRKKLKA